MDQENIEYTDLFDFESLIHYGQDPSVDTFNAFTSAGLFDSSYQGPPLAGDPTFVPATPTEYSFYNNNAYLTPTPAFTASPQDFRPAVDNWAAGDARARPMKEKRRDAAIDFHIQRSSSAPHYPHSLPAKPQQASDAHSASYSRESSQESFTEKPQSVGSVSHATPGSSRSEQFSEGTPGSMELVLDMNMNAATQLPKKQRKRTKAEIEDYINVRRNGACLKHRKQHKKCNCLDKIISTPGTPKVRTKNSRDKQPSLTQTPSPYGSIQFPSSSQASSLQPLSQVDTLARGEVGNSSLPSHPSQNMHPSPYQELPRTSSAFQQPDFTCLMPHCTFRTHSIPELNEHYQMHPRPNHPTHDARYLHNMEHGLAWQYPQQPLHLMGSSSHMGSPLSEPFSSPSTASLMRMVSLQGPEMTVESQAMGNHAQILHANSELAVQLPSNEPLDPSARHQPDSSTRHQRRIYGPEASIRQPVEVSHPFEVEARQQSQQHPRDRSLRTNAQPLEEITRDTARVETIEHLRKRGSRRNLQLEKLPHETDTRATNRHLPLEEPLAWRASSDLLTRANLMLEMRQASHLYNYILLCSVAVIQTLVTFFDTLVRVLPAFLSTICFTERDLSAIIKITAYR